MGFGCNAAGVVGCRIIDSPRERLLAILTNSFVPCNGRFPTLIALITMFFVGTGGSFGDSVLSSFMLTGVIVFSVGITFFVTRFLSGTILKGVPSFCTGPGGRRRRSRRHGFVDSCKCIGERSKSARRLLRFS